MAASIKRVLYKLLILFKAHRLVIGIAQGEISVLILEGWGQPQVTQCLREPIDTQGSILAYAVALQRLLGHNEISAFPCTIVLSDQWVRWVSIPWVGVSLSPLELDALIRARLTDLYGDMGEWTFVAGKVHFGEALLAAAVPKALLNSLLEVLSKNDLKLQSFQPAHVAAFNRWHSCNIKKCNGELITQDYIFATADTNTLTLSWTQQSQEMPHRAVTGVRSIRLGGTNELPLKLIQREILIQQLNDPQVCLLMLDRLNDKNVNPQNWCIMDASDHGRLSVASAFGQLFIPVQTDQEMFAEKPHRDILPIGIDFATNPARLRISPRWMFAAGIALMIIVGTVLGHLNAQLAGLEDELHKQEDVEAKQAETKVLTEPQKAELADAQKIVASINRPWNRLFHAIEESTNPDVTLLEMSPDAQAGYFHLSGNARSFKAILVFVQSLKYSGERNNELRDVYLASYQVNTQDMQRTIHFEVNAQWHPTTSIEVNDSAARGGKQ